MVSKVYTSCETILKLRQVVHERSILVTLCSYLFNFSYTLDKTENTLCHQKGQVVLFLHLDSPASAWRIMLPKRPYLCLKGTYILEN